MGAGSGLRVFLFVSVLMLPTSCSGPGAQVLPADPLEATIATWSKRRADTWAQAQQQKTYLPQDSKWPGAMGAEVNRSLGFVEATDQVLVQLRQMRALPQGAERVAALAALNADLARRRADTWRRVEEQKRTVNPNFPDRFGAELNQMIGMVDAFDEALKAVARLQGVPAGAVVPGSYAGPVVLRSRLSAAKGTLRLSIQNGRVTGVLEAMSTLKDGSIVTQRGDVAGTIGTDGAVAAQVRGQSRYQNARPEEKFSYIAGTFYTYSFSGTLNGRFAGPEGRGTLSLKGLEQHAKDVILTSDWALTPTR